MKITELRPKKVFHYFSEISKIPHGSGNTEQIARYCMEFANEHNLKSYSDHYGNVMIFKNGTAGYEEYDPVIIQGHLDMVCEKRSDCDRDMEKDGLELVTDGEYLWAGGTTLGGDDGIAVAYILALLASDDIVHPPIEALLTADEEIGLRGANALDMSQFKGRRLINIDSEEEGVFTVSCAGGVRMVCSLPLKLKETKNEGICARKIKIGGLRGGHSGMDINKSRRNAAKTLAELLYELNKQIEINIADVYSGGRTNVIPRAAEAVVCFKESFLNVFNSIISAFDSNLKISCINFEPDAYAAAENISVPPFSTDRNSTDKLIFLLMQIMDGVYAMSPDIPELVQTSSNMGSMSFKDEYLSIELMIRSNTDFGKKALVRKLESLVEYVGGDMYCGDDYPAWEYMHNSPLRDIMIKVYRDMYGDDPRICSIHAGLECGVFANKLPGVDMVSIGPDMEKVHTPDERLSIQSAERCWNYLLRLLECLK